MGRVLNKLNFVVTRHWIFHGNSRKVKKIMNNEHMAISCDRMSRGGGNKLRMIFPHISVLSKLPNCHMEHFLFLDWGRVGSPEFSIGVPYESMEKLP